MRKNVNYGSIETASSDYETQDGNLSATYNLISEGGSLVPLDAKGKSTGVTIPDNCSLMYMHQTSWRGVYRNRYIIKCVKDGVTTFYHLTKDEDGTIVYKSQEDISDGNKLNILNPDQVNSVTSVGNILCFVGDSSTQYALCKDDEYIVYYKDDFRFDIQVTIEQTHVGEDTYKEYIDPLSGVTLGGSYDWKDGMTSAYNGFYDLYCCQMADSNFPISDHTDDPKYLTSLTGEQMRELYLSMDATIAKRISAQDKSKEIFRHIQLGVAAVKLYDGTYYAFSDIFVLAPNLEPFYNIYDMAYASVEEGSDETKSIPIDVVDANGNLIQDSDRPFLADMALSPNLKRIYYGNQVYKALLQIDYYHKAGIEAMKNLVQSVDIFLTTPQTFFDFEQGAGYKYHCANSSTDDTSMYFYDFARLSDKKTAEAIEGLGFYKSESIPIDDILSSNTSKHKVYLESVTGTEETINLGDLRRVDYGAKYSKVYNKRLHLANVLGSYQLNAPLHVYMRQSRVGGRIIAYFCDVAGRTVKDHYTNLGMKRIYIPSYLGVICDLPEDVEKKIVVTLSDKTHLSDYCSMSYPHMPLVMVGLPDVTNMSIYYQGSSEYNYQKLDLQLETSANMGLSYVTTYKGDFGVKTQSLLLPVQCYIHSMTYNSNTQEWDEKLSLTGLIKTISGTKYDSITKAITKGEANIVKVSEVENPLVFPAKNTIDNIGGTIVGMAVNTQPISSAQFGEYPLYIFTDECVWAAKINTTTNDTGTYVSVAPVSNDKIDISNNGGTSKSSVASNILEIGSAVVYPSERGLMMLSGYKQVCITDKIYGYPFDFSVLPHLEDILDKSGSNITMSDIDYLTMTDSGKTKSKTWYWQDGTSMYYDNAQQRIILSAASSKWLLAYSIKSGRWGAANNNVGGAVTYNSSLCVVNESLDGSSVNTIYNIGSEHQDTYNVLAITRPIGGDSKNALKSINQIISRGDYIKGHIKSAVYASRDLYTWRLLNTSVDHYLRNRVGTPYKYYITINVGTIDYDESLTGLTLEGAERFDENSK